ncbi:unnamed protein product [Nyctereutes procyonoides]|uniref:(raccoon dog) hypothetical protein n=1 Tax=Nyctereutes procyonoides TaxID=34880 RepID=A0A811Z3Q4_NYCPR|nr:unnamed protein product [Nyctereutes procyonoides]
MKPALCPPLGAKAAPPLPEGAGKRFCEWNWLQTWRCDGGTGNCSCTAKRGQCGLNGERASTMKWNQICPMKPRRTELLEHEVQELPPALLRRDIIYIFNFLEDYHVFGSTAEVLDLLFTKYGCIVTAYEENDGDFCQLPEFPSLTKLLAFMGQYMPGSDLENHVWYYLKQFRCLHPVEPEAGASAREQHPEPPQEPAPAPTVGPAPPSGPEVIEPMPAAESKPLQTVVTSLVHCSALEEPPAPLGSLENEQAPAPAIEVTNVLEQSPNSMEQPALDPKQHPEPPQEPAPRPEVIKPVPAAGAEGLARSVMLAPESKSVHVVVAPLIPCPDEEEPPAPLATREEE